MNYILLHKQNADNTRSSASQNFILFHCPLDGERFKKVQPLLSFKNSRYEKPESDSFGISSKEACTFAILHRYRLYIFLTCEFPKLLLFYRNVTRSGRHRLVVNLDQIVAVEIRNDRGLFFRFQLRPHGIHNTD